jgi:hypothetical protein
MVDGAVLINLSVIRMNWLASKHNLKMAGRSFGWKKNYGLTVTVSSEPWWVLGGPLLPRLRESSNFCYLKLKLQVTKVTDVCTINEY